MRSWLVCLSMYSKATPQYMGQFLDSLVARERGMSPVDLAMKEAEEAITQVLNGRDSVELNPRMPIFVVCST